MAQHYRRPPWEFDDVPEDELVAEAETIDLRREIREVMDA